MENKTPSKTGRNVFIVLVIAVAVFALVFVGINLTKNIGKSETEISQETMKSRIEKMMNKVNITTTEPRKGTVQLGETELKDELPEITKYPPSVEGDTALNVEIFSSTEKGGEGTDGWLTETAKRFNAEKIQIGSQVVSVTIRPVTSGLAYDYITSGKYLPDAYTPSNELWGEMLKAEGVPIELLEKRLVGNVSGIMMQKKQYDEFIKNYGSVNVKTISEATIANELAMGYTNPLASSTGLNFLISLLNNFDSKNPLADAAVTGFEEFQANVPYVAYSTLQMRDAAKTGSLNAMILEQQLFANAKDLGEFEFVPFGVRHDNPMYSVGTLDADKQELLKQFTAYCLNADSQKLAVEYGFNQYDDYKSEEPDFPGDTLIRAQKIWKEKKDAGRPVVAVFVTDISGSMDGEPMNQLKTSLLNASQYINPDNSIGLVSYNSSVYVNLPIAKFDLNQRAYFAGAVEGLMPTGGTATFDGILTAMDMILKEKEVNPDAKYLIFVLSDGDTNSGHSLKDIRELVQASEIPVYTIGYNADIEALNAISSINEAANINADSEDVVYQLKSFFNAQM